MGSQCFQVHIYLRVGIILILLADIGFCELSSPPFSKLCSREYISEAYFQRHDSLLDWDFQDFMATELPLGFCEVLEVEHDSVPRMSVVRRRLIGEGSHRHLTSSLRFESQPVVFSKLPAHFCEAIIVERLPSGVFADPFELQHLIQHGAFTDASVFGDTDLELPTVQANRSVVEIHVDMGPNTLSGNKNGLELNIELPLHARYAPLGEIGCERVTFGSPDLLVRCIVEMDSHNQSCIFSPTSSNARSTADPIIWKVPSGIVEHTTVVSVLTFISAVVSAFSIFFVCAYFLDTAGLDGSKQS